MIGGILGQVRGAKRTRSCREVVNQHNNTEVTMKLHLLGTGTPEPSLKRMSSGYLLRVGEDVILFDLGPGAYHRLMEVGVACTDVTHVFFSHLHYDHCADFVRLFLNRWDMGAGKVPPMKVYGPPGTAQFVERLFGPEGAFALDLTARTQHVNSINIYKSRGGVPPRLLPETDVTEIKESDVVEGDGWRVELANVPHFQPYLICYGFRLEAEDGVFAYSGDCGPCKAMHELAREADVLVHMLSRIAGLDVTPEPIPDAMSHKDLAALGRDAGVKTLVASHVNPRVSRDDVRERVIAEMAEIYKGTLIWGENLMEIVIGEG